MVMILKASSSRNLATSSRVSRFSVAVFAGMLLARAPISANAAIPEPDVVYYGTVTVGAVVQQNSAIVSVRKGATTLATYTLGTLPGAVSQGNALYVLRVPLANLVEVTPPSTPAASKADKLDFYINGVLDPDHSKTLPDDITYASIRGMVTRNDIGVTAVCDNDGTKESAEECDDGNTKNGDCCSSLCKFESTATVCGDDGNACTDQKCNGAGACILTNLNGTTCNDSVFCNGTDTCQTGVCNHLGDPCAGNSVCSAQCLEESDSCGAQPNTACNDQNPCNGTDKCFNGGCNEHTNVSLCPGSCDPVLKQCPDCVAITIAQDVQCEKGVDCSVELDIDRMNFPVAAVNGTLMRTDGTITCETVCGKGAAATNATECTVSADTCEVLIQDLTQPTSFGDGELARVTMQCNSAGQGSLCIGDLSVAGPDSVAKPVCAPSCVEFECTECKRGDCSGSGQLDASDPLCTIFCVLGDPAPQSDCSCAADCNCTGGVEVSDVICASRRVLGTFNPALDPCLAVGNEAASLTRSAVNEARGVHGVLRASERWTEDERLGVLSVKLAGDGAATTGAAKILLSSEVAALGRVRLARRLRLAGFSLNVEGTASHAVAIVTPPMDGSIPAMGAGRIVVVKLPPGAVAAVAVTGAELGTVDGLPMSVSIAP